MSTGIRTHNSNSAGYCKLVAGCVGGASLAIAYQMGAIGPALTAIGAIGCLWAIASSRNTSGERDLNSSRIVSNNPEQIAVQVSGLITPDMDDRTHNALIATVARIPVNERGQVIGLVSRFQQMCNTTHIVPIISDVARIPANEREQVTYFASRLIRPEMLSMSISAIIAAVAKTPPNEREQVAYLASRFFTPSGLGLHDVSIISTVAKIPANERVHFFNLASSLITQEMQDWARSLIIRAVARARNEREARVQRVLHQLPQDLANGLENQNIVHRMIVILETPLNQPIPPLRAEMAELAAQGQNAINVHHGSRDAKTREAIELLIKQQGELTPIKISNAVDSFKEHLNDYKGNSVLKAKAQQALNGPPEIWPPLLHNNALHAIDGGRLRISGEELIARLWIFANEQSEERENCRFGIIKALSDSIELDGRVCPPGQMQRQVIAVLQGRLKDVNVDNVDVARKTLNEHTSAFITDNIRANRTQLIQAANQYLNGHPDVNRDAFIAAINTYADTMGL